MKYRGLVLFFYMFSSVQLLSCVWLFATPWTAARQASLSITNSQSLRKPMSIELVMPSNHLIFCHPLLLLPSIFPSIRVFSDESAICISWPKYWNFSFNNVNIQFSKHHLLTILCFLPWLFLVALSNISCCINMGLFMGFQFHSISLCIHFYARTILFWLQ